MKWKIRGSTAGARMVAVGAWLSATACASGIGPLRPGPAPAPAPAPATHVVWTPDPRPAVFSGRVGWPTMPIDPSIYVDEEGYHLFYSTFFCHGANGLEFSWNPADPASCKLENPVTAITYAFSGDRGATWRFRRSPVVRPGETGFDAGRIETAAMFRLGDTLYAAYSADGQHEGRPFPSRYQIGLAWIPLEGRSVRDALLDDAQQFRRRAEPLLPFDLRSGRFDNNVQEPSVVVGPDGIILYYLGLGVRQPDQPLGVPGQTITSLGLGRAVLDRNLNVVSRSASPILQGVNMPEARYLSGAYHLFATTLSSGNAHKGGALVMATSADGVTWTPPQVIVSPGTTPGLDDWGLMGPTVAVERDHLLLFYTAFGAVQRDCVSAGPEGRFGIPQPEGSLCVYVTIGRAVPRAVAPAK